MHSLDTTSLDFLLEVCEDVVGDAQGGRMVLIPDGLKWTEVS
jgi:hypothetical protein